MTSKETTLTVPEADVLSDSARMEALQRYALLDTPAEEAFDRLTGSPANSCMLPSPWFR